METISNIIGGQPTRSASQRTAPVFNPATGEQSAVLPLSTAAELDAAVAAAKAALPAWADMPPLKRARFMFRFKELLDDNVDAHRPGDLAPSTARPTPMPSARSSAASRWSSSAAASRTC